MTRERAKELAPIIAAYGEGKDVQKRIGAAWVTLLESDWADTATYRIKPEPKKRRMNLEEVLAILTPVVIRPTGGDRDDWRAPWDKEFETWPVCDLEYAYVKDGKIGEPQAFEVDA